MALLVWVAILILTVADASPSNKTSNAGLNPVEALADELAHRLSPQQLEFLKGQQFDVRRGGRRRRTLSTSSSAQQNYCHTAPIVQGLDCFYLQELFEWLQALQETAAESFCYTQIEDADGARIVTPADSAALWLNQLAIAGAPASLATQYFIQQLACDLHANSTHHDWVQRRLGVVPSIAIQRQKVSYQVQENTRWQTQSIKKELEGSNVSRTGRSPRSMGGRAGAAASATAKLETALPREQREIASKPTHARKTELSSAEFDFPSSPRGQSQMGKTEAGLTTGASTVVTELYQDWIATADSVARDDATDSLYHTGSSTFVAGFYQIRRRHENTLHIHHGISLDTTAYCSGNASHARCNTTSPTTAPTDPPMDQSGAPTARPALRVSEACGPDGEAVTPSFDDDLGNNTLTMNVAGIDPSSTWST